MTQGPAALGLSQARGQPPRKCQPSAFFHTRLREKGSGNGRGLTAAQDHVLARSPGHRLPSGRKGLRVLVTLPLL